MCSTSTVLLSQNLGLLVDRASASHPCVETPTVYFKKTAVVSAEYLDCVLAVLFPSDLKGEG